MRPRPATAVNTITTGPETYLVVPTLEDAGGGAAALGLLLVVDAALLWRTRRT